MRPVLLLSVLVGCGPDLPAGWKFADPAVRLTQSPCGNSPLEPFDEGFAADLTVDPPVVEIFESHFRCEQEVEAFYKTEGGRLDILVQPIDMKPKVVAACDCLYDLDIVVGAFGRTLESVTVWRRWDHMATDDPAPVPIDEIVR